MTMIVGVDPGLSGAIAWLLDGGLVAVEDMPTVAGHVNAYELTRIISDIGKVERVAVEQVHSMPKQGVASVFKFGQGYGTVLGVLAALERPVVHVTPSTWVKHHRLVGGDKAAHRARCMDLYPAQADLFLRAKDDGRADAVLIALWATYTQMSLDDAETPRPVDTVPGF